MRFVLLGLPPTTNNLYAIVGGRQVLSETGRRFHESVAAVIRRMHQGDPSAAPFAVLVTYHLGAYDRDVDGSHKALIDGFAPKGRDGERHPILWHDDRQLVLFAARKRRLPKGVLPYVSVVVRELAQKPAFHAPALPALLPIRRRVDFTTDRIPPSANNTYTPFGGGRGRVKTREAKETMAFYRSAFGALAADMAAVAGADPSPVAQAIATDGRLFPAHLRLRLRYGFDVDRRDVDGSHKLLLDAARGILWDDDRQITSFSVAKARVAKGTKPCIEGGAWAVS